MTLGGRGFTYTFLEIYSAVIELILLWFIGKYSIVFYPVGIVDQNHKIIANHSVRTLAERNYKEIVKDMADAVFLY